MRVAQGNIWPLRTSGWLWPQDPRIGPNMFHRRPQHLDIPGPEWW